MFLQQRKKEVNNKKRDSDKEQWKKDEREKVNNKEKLSEKVFMENNLYSQINRVKTNSENKLYLPFTFQRISQGYKSHRKSFSFSHVI